MGFNSAFKGLMGHGQPVWPMDIKNRINKRDACYRYLQNFLSSCVLSSYKLNNS